MKLSILLIPAFIWEENLEPGLKQKCVSFNILEKKNYVLMYDRTTTTNSLPQLEHTYIDTFFMMHKYACKWFYNECFI